MSSSSPFGVLDFLAWDHDWNRHHYPIEAVKRAAGLMQEAGVGFVRMDFLWSDLEPREGQFDFSKYDALVDILCGHGLGILGLLHYNPAWRQGPWNAAPDPAAFERYARAVAKHFKGAVAHWEIWNEPDHPIYWHPQDSLEAYARLLKRIYPVLKEADPQCQVLIGGLTNTVSNNLERLYEQAGAESFDIVNIHPFVSPLADRPVEELRRMVDHTRGVMQRYGDGAKPIWVTEIGCPGSAENQTWWLGKSLDENRQAEWVASVYAEALQWKNVEKIFWAFFRDTQDHFKDAVDHFGLVRHDFTPKAAYAAYRAAARRLTPS